MRSDQDVLHQPALATVRPGRDRDSAGFIALIGGCWAEYPGQVFDVDGELPELYALASYFNGKGGALWAAEAGGEVVGMVATYPAEDGWHLSRMYVRADQRGTGVAATLLDRAQDHARAAGGTRMVLWSDVLFLRAHAFYEKHGFLRRGGLKALGDLSNSIEAGFAKPLTGLVVERLDVAAAESAERPLAALLQMCAEEGVGLGVLPSQAAAYWRAVTKAVGRGETALFVAWIDGMLSGTVQLELATPQDQAHRAAVRMLLVRPDHRRAGAGRALMGAATLAGRTLLTMEVRAGQPAEALLHALGWTRTGRLPGAIRDAAGGAFDATLFHTAREADHADSG